MQTAKIQSFSPYGTLRELYSRLDSQIYHQIRTKSRNQKYGVELPFSSDTFQRLLHYKRIVLKRIYNDTYPGADIDIADIISQVTLLLSR